MPSTHHMRRKDDHDEVVIIDQRDIKTWEDKGWERFVPLAIPLNQAPPKDPGPPKNLIKVYKPDGTVGYCDSKQLGKLLECGWTREPPDEAKEEDDSGQDPSPNEGTPKDEVTGGAGAAVDREATIIEALSRLDHNKDEDWTSGGLPNLKRVSELTGFRGLKREEVEAASPGFVRMPSFSAGPME